MANGLLVLTAQASFDPRDSSSRARAHAMVDSLFASVGDEVNVNLSDGNATRVHADAVKSAERVLLKGEELREVLRDMAIGHMGVQLNDGERQMLAAIANQSPEPLNYEDNRVLLGTGPKFGNVSSGLARRFRTRGYELPYSQKPNGYAMTPEIARVVTEVLTETSGDSQKER